MLRWMPLLSFSAWTATATSAWFMPGAGPAILDCIGFFGFGRGNAKREWRVCGVRQQLVECKLTVKRWVGMRMKMRKKKKMEGPG